MEQNITKDDNKHRMELVAQYKPDVELLIRYLPWLKEKAGKKTSENFAGEGIAEHSVSFPVYDSTLMALVKDAQRTGFMDRNHVYVYSRNHLRTPKDEIAFIHNCNLEEMGMLAGILSHYIMGGMTKGTVWTEGVQNGVLYEVIYRMYEIIKFNDSGWDKVPF